MNLTESEKNRIRGLHKENSVIKESWGSKQDEYGRTDGHRHGDVDGHYKDYEGEYGGNAHEYKRTDGHRTGDVGGHYKTYEFNEQEPVHIDDTPDFVEGDDVIGVDRPESRGAQARYDTFGEGDTEFDVTETDINLTEDTEGEETYHYGEDEGEDHDEEMDLEHDEDMAPHDRIDAIEKHLDALKKDMSYDEDREDRDEDGDDFE